MISEDTTASPIGILDLQGGVAEHINHFQRLDVAVERVKQPSQFKNLAGLVIPGGESTCLMRLLNNFGLTESVMEAYKSGTKIWGTCAGAILVATEVTGEGPKLGFIEMEIERNAFGSQLASFQRYEPVPAISEDPLPMTFIRAPKIHSIGAEVSCLLDMEGYMAVVESPQVLVTVFHPELTSCLSFHRYFAQKCSISTNKDSDETGGKTIDTTWHPTSWTTSTTPGIRKTS